MKKQEILNLVEQYKRKTVFKLTIIWVVLIIFDMLVANNLYQEVKDSHTLEICFTFGGIVIAIILLCKIIAHVLVDLLSDKPSG